MAEGYLIAGARLLDATGAAPSEGVSLLVEGKRIARIGPDAEVAAEARSRGGVWTIVFDGPEPRGPAPAPSRDDLAVVHTGHSRRDGADDRIVELVGALPDPAAALVYTSDSALRDRVRALGGEVAGARALLKEIAAVGDTTDRGAG